MATDATIEVAAARPVDSVKPAPSMGSQSQLSLLSGSSTGSQGSQYNFNRILRWLQFVDENLESSSNQLLYLGAYAELKNRASEGITLASHVYHLLKERSNDDTRTLARYMYALKKLGRKRRGIYCNRQFFNILKMQPPSLEEFDVACRENQEFGFYQCLVDICVNLEEDKSLSKQVRIYTCRHVLGVLHENERTVAMVFLKMLKRPEVLSKNNQDQLALVLGQVGATSCLLILQYYRSQFKLTEIEWENITPYLKTEQITPASSTSTLDSPPVSLGSNSSSASPTSHLLNTGGSRGSSPRDVPPTIDEEHHEHEEIENPAATEQTRLLQQGVPGANPPPLRLFRRTEKRFWRKRVLIPFIVLGISTLIAAGLGLSLIVLAAIEASSIDTQTTVYMNTTAAIGNVQNFTTKQVTIYEDPEVSEVTIPLSIYTTKEHCNNLHSTAGKSDPVHNESIHLLQSQIIIFRGYLLDGSEMRYNICAVTNQINAASEYHVDFYIADGLDENLSFDPDTSTSVLHRDVDLVYDHDLKQPSSLCFKSITYTVRKRGYYSVILFPPSQTEVPFTNLSLWYDQNNILKVIDTSRLTPTCSGSSVSRDDPCTITIGSTEHLISVFCIVVEVGYSSYDPYTHIDAAVTGWDSGQIWFYVLGGFVSTCVTVFVVCLCKRSKK